MARASNDANWFATIRTTLCDQAALIVKSLSLSIANNLSLQSGKGDAAKASTMVEANDLEVKTIIESVASATVAKHAALDTGLRA